MVLRVTYIVSPGQEPMPVYEAEGGMPVFVTDDPYLLSDGLSLMSPLYVVDAGGPTWVASDGSLQAALPVETT